MNEQEFLTSGCNNRNSKVTYKDNRIAYGVITTYFPQELQSYYLVPSSKMIEFARYMQANDYEKMRKLAIPVNFDDIAKTEQVDAFGELLIKKNQEAEKVNWDDRRNKWLKSIEGFYTKINFWLAEFQSGGLIGIRQKEINLNEEYIGHYKTKQLDIILGNDIITLTPRATLIIGSYGRIDMRGPKGEVMIVEPEWDDWKFFVRTPKITYLPVNEQSFKEALQQIING